MYLTLVPATFRASGNPPHISSISLTASLHLASSTSPRFASLACTSMSTASFPSVSLGSKAIRSPS
ncbi:unnamed protein product [Chondrus crispus]|uniref:Uncharacterized protein n=1 Tax=Chondrus crispus TaxID=2769 RepID=R7QNP0_CHOCR|nr:unnamed protein product [Chondrus crispus]CDF39724.1 unnamed protein product [Chondrus crispus]|eukprot:XP_005710018.1 unnamed protein product [Chondrus crispus]